MKTSLSSLLLVGALAALVLVAVAQAAQTATRRGGTSEAQFVLTGKRIQITSNPGLPIQPNATVKVACGPKNAAPLVQKAFMWPAGKLRVTVTFPKDVSGKVASCRLDYAGAVTGQIAAADMR